MDKRTGLQKFYRITLGTLLTILALNAFGGGFYGITGAKDIPVEWLRGSPFPNYFIPGLFLFVVIGGSAMVASIMVFRQHPLARIAAFGCGILVLAWLLVQVFIIGYVSWMQPATAIVAVLILLVTPQLPKHVS